MVANPTTRTDMADRKSVRKICHLDMFNRIPKSDSESARPWRMMGDGTLKEPELRAERANAATAIPPRSLLIVGRHNGGGAGSASCLLPPALPSVHPTSPVCSVCECQYRVRVCCCVVFVCVIAHDAATNCGGGVGVCVCVCLCVCVCVGAWVWVYLC